MDRIFINGIEAFGYHGVLPEERERGQRFLVDLSIGLDLTRATESDDLADTVDYSEVATGVAGIVSEERYDLLESLADRIASFVLRFTPVMEVDVVVSKPDAPMECEAEEVGVFLHRTEGGERDGG